MTNEQLVIRIKAGENVAENMEQLYNQCCRFIHSVAWKYRAYEDIEDLKQEGYLALYDAVDGYDPDKGVKFLSYAEYWIRQRVQRYIQTNGSCLRIPVHCLDRVQQYNRFCSSFSREYGRKSTDQEAAAHMGLTLEQIENIKKGACMTKLGSLDAPVKGLDGGEDTTVGDFVADAENLEEGVVDRIYLEQRAAELWECVDMLEGQQPDVIRKRYQGGMTLDQIGQEYGVTRERIRQTESRALRELRKPRNSARLRSYLPEAERIYSAAISGNGVGRFNRTWTSSTERVALKAMDWEERRREHLEWLDKVRQRLEISSRVPENFR